MLPGTRLRSHLRAWLCLTWVLVLPLILSACGFQLRQAPHFAFKSIYVTGDAEVATIIRRSLAANPEIKLITDAAQNQQADVILDITQDKHDKNVTGSNTTGQVTEFQLHQRVKFRLRKASGDELIAQTEITRQYYLNYNETLALAKEQEENFIVSDMQKDVAQQILRRLSVVKLP